MCALFVIDCVVLYGVCLCLWCLCVMCLNGCGSIVIYCVMVYGRLFVLVCVCVRVGFMCLSDLVRRMRWLWCLFACGLCVCVFCVRCVA